MFCKWCGLESETSDLCSWCGQPFSAPTQPVTEPPVEPPAESAVVEPAAQPPAGLAAPVVPTSDTPAPPPLPDTRPPVSTPVLAPEERPDLTAIPIKRQAGRDIPSAPPPVIPISKTGGAAAQPPASAAPPPSTPIPPSAPPKLPSVTVSPSNRAPLTEPAPEVPTPPADDRIPHVLGEAPEEEPQIGAVPSRSGTTGAGLGAPPQPPSGGTATATRAPARIYCRWCGMESETDVTCSWCRKDLRFAPAAKTVDPTNRGPEPVKKGPKRQEVKSAPAVDPNGNGAGSVAVGVPELGTFTAQKSRYYPDKVYDPVSGAHYDADTGTAEVPPQVGHEPEQVLEPIYDLNQVAINIAILIGLAVAGSLLLQRQPEWYLTMLGVTNFFAGMAMPLLRTVPFGEDDSSDIGVVIGLTLILGPFVGSILYFFLCIVKQDFSPAMVGVFVSYLVLRFTLDATIGLPIMKIMPWYEFTPETIGAQIMPFVTIAGWYAAGMFHKPDE